MKHRAIVLALIMGLAPGFVRGQTATELSPSQIYRLTDKSQYQEGCFPPCMCPIMASNAITGTFRLGRASQDPLFTTYALTDVNLIVPLDAREIRITGTGSYKIGGEFALVHQLQLALKVGDRDIQKFDSGLVVGGSEFPAINLTVAMNGMICQDTAITIAAVPVRLAEIAPYSVAGSSYEQGCFGACDCAVSSAPAYGKFGLVKLADAGGIVTFGVVDVNWRVGREVSLGTTDGLLVNGFGIYRVDSSTRGQRMLLDLKLDGRGPQRFDSGLVPGGGNPFRIDIALAANRFACFDQVFDLHARRVRPPTTMGAEPSRKGRGHRDRAAEFADPQ